MNQNPFQPAPRAFISYARADGESFATKLRERLEIEQPEITLWQDRTRLDGGVGWWRQITDALDHVEFLIMVMTPAAMISDVARKEWRYARQQGVRICPVMGVPARELDFAVLPRWMSKAQFYDLGREWDTFIGFLKSARRASRVPFMAPDLREDFVERPTQFEALLSKLIDRERTDPVAITTALQGFGGFGKTTLAIAVCHHEDVSSAFDDGILWATLGQNPNLQHELTKLYAALTGERPPFIDVDDAAIQLATRLEDKDCLIVIDDVWDPEHVKPFLRGGTRCARLITTRRLEVVTDLDATRVLVDEMTEDESVRMLTARLGSPPADLGPFRLLANRLGEWPLLLKLAGSQLRERIERGDSLGGALAYVNRALEKRGPSALDNKTGAVHRSIAASLELLQPSDRVRCAELAIFPEDKVVPLSAVRALWGADEFDTEELVQRLDGAALIDFDLKTGTIRIHDVLRSYLHSRLDDPRAVHVRLLESGWPDPYALPDSFAWRWFGWHLNQAGRHDRLRALLRDFNWLKAKLEATDVRSLLLDFELQLDADDLHHLHDAVRLSAHGLNRDPGQLAVQLKGRLERSKSESIDALLAQAEARVSRPWLTVLHASFTRPGGPLIAILKGHTGSVEAVALSLDGRRAVSAAADWTLRVWDLEAGRTIHSLEGHSGLVHCVAVSRDGRRAVSGSEDRSVRLWNLDSGQNESVMKGHSGAVYGVVISPDGSMAASASEDGTVRSWDLESGRSAVLFKGQSHQLRALAITPDSRQLLFGQGDWSLVLVDLASRSVLKTFEGHSGVVRAVVVSSDGTRALSASNDGTLRLWDMSTAQTVVVLSGHAGAVDGVAITADGHRAVSASTDQTLRVWDLATGNLLHALEGHSSFVRSVATTTTGTQAVSGSGDKTIRHWNLESAPTLQPLKAHPDPVSLLAISADGRKAVSGSRGRVLRVWDTETDQVVGMLEGHSDIVSSLWISADGNKAITTSRDRTLRVWDLASCKPVSVCSHAQSVRTARITPDGARAATLSRDRTISLWDLERGRVMRVLVSEEEERNVARPQDGGALLSELEIAPVVNTIPKAIGRDSEIAISADGECVLIALAGSLCAWDIATGAILSEEMEDWDAVAMAIDGERRVAVIGTRFGSIRLWDLSTGSTIHALEGHRVWVPWRGDDLQSVPGRGRGLLDIAISPDGQSITSAAQDDTLRVWDMRSGREQLVLQGRQGKVDEVVLAPNGNVAYSIYGDTVVATSLTEARILGSVSVDHQITVVAVVADGKHLALGDESGRVHFLRLEEAEPTSPNFEGHPDVSG